jgi:hypothetical protein
MMMIFFQRSQHNRINLSFMMEAETMERKTSGKTSGESNAETPGYLRVIDHRQRWEFEAAGSRGGKVLIPSLPQTL